MKKTLSIFLCLFLLLGNVATVRAEDAPIPPVAPTAPEAPSAPTAPEAPSAPTAPENQSQQPTPRPTRAPQPETTLTPTSTTTPVPSSTPTPVQPQSVQPTSTPAVGQSTILTGNDTNSAVVTTVGNNNINADSEVSSDTSGGSAVVNSTNGAFSENHGSIVDSSTRALDQNNNANVDNSIDLQSNTGDNNTSYTVGNSLIKTGDSNVSGTAITAVNTNVDGIAVAEFNIDENQTGDYVLDYSKNCISGCAAKNIGNGSGSQNAADIANTQNNATFQKNDATVGNQLVLAANSGNNAGNYNTGGDTLIKTGDANVSANSLTFANNNLAGNVVYGVVNIYGDLHGDIVFPEEMVANIGNGANSNNTSNTNNSTANSLDQSNQAFIDNNLELSASTGGNTTSGNTGGSSYLSTGDANTTAQVLNVANTNVSDGTTWLVLVNQAGNWIGQIMGAPAGSTYAGSAGTQFSTSPSGAITATNGGNGANTNNTTSVSQNTQNALSQTNNANIGNNLQLSANTGGNSTSYNTGGDNGIQTGDANIVANLVNFVNNNVASNGKLVVTVVNVFGSWVGDLVTPGQKKQPIAPEPKVAIGGAAVVVSPTNAPNPTSTPVQQTPETSSSTTALTAKVVVKSAVLGSTSSAKPTNSNPEPTTVPAVSGAQFTQPSKKVVKVNLAWFILLLPLFAIGFPVVRKLRARN